MFGFKSKRGVSETVGTWEKTYGDRLIPVRLVEGGWDYHTGQLWRRTSPTGYQYTQDLPTWEEWEAQAW